MKINKLAAERILLEEAQKEEIKSDWVTAVERLSAACENAAKTHIAFLGTALLAKAVSLKADALAVKAKSTAPGQSPLPGAYSARSLCHGVLVPLSTELGINLGVTGREPLNNQPYFRMIRIDDGTPVHPTSRHAFEILIHILHDINKISTQEEAKSALRSFIQVRRLRQPNYAKMAKCDDYIPVWLFCNFISNYAGTNSEGGKKAQAIISGLLDVFAGEERVDSSRVNDPDRHYPGDVVIFNRIDKDKIEKSFEVRDKPVSASDVILFGQKVLEHDIRESAVIAVNQGQSPIDIERIQKWANERKLGLSVFFGWNEFIYQVIFWSELPEPYAVSTAIRRIHRRLISVEVSEEAVQNWATGIANL